MISEQTENELDLVNAVPDTFLLEGISDFAQEPATRFVCFQIGSGHYAVKADSVAEVSHPLPITKLPGGLGPLLGISSLRGEIVAVIDLRQLLKENPPVSSSKTKFVVLLSANGSSPLAIPVDGMRDMISAHPLHETKKRPFVAGSLQIGDKRAELLDIDELRDAISRCTM